MKLLLFLGLLGLALAGTRRRMKGSRGQRASRQLSMGSLDDEEIVIYYTDGDYPLFSGDDFDVLPEDFDIIPEYPEGFPALPDAPAQDQPVPPPETAAPAPPPEPAGPPAPAPPEPEEAAPDPFSGDMPPPPPGAVNDPPPAPAPAPASGDAKYGADKKPAPPPPAPAYPRRFGRKRTRVRGRKRTQASVRRTQGRNCGDKHPSCRFWTSFLAGMKDPRPDVKGRLAQDYCEVEKAVMYGLCPESCGVCPGAADRRLVRRRRLLRKRSRLFLRRRSN